jgi:hypothetical protein
VVEVDVKGMRLEFASLSSRLPKIVLGLSLAFFKRTLSVHYLMLTRQKEN